ncbi:MAG TPA: CBS domain-containing protein [Actinophytocola sp.]|uniref:CBS domain-containing protein n=1 Tax=Actinophytocola sp. TaxID=1872138 RepID=UPI002DB63ABA|nr:CBS domain-containing protein [Actinophytocola sp.]HEU5471658.1 CBS domain-containing protein [Actinophytocola sp.]
MLEPKVSSVMTAKVISVTPETSFKDVVMVLFGNDIGAVPVIGPGGGIVGVVSEADVLPKQEFHGGSDPVPHGAPRRRVRWYRAQGLCAAEVMTAPVATIGPDEPVAVAARRLAEEGVRRLFVADGGELVGVVSRRDILGMFLRPDEEIRAAVEDAVLRGELGLAPGTVRVSVEAGVVAVAGELAKRSETGLVTHLIRGVPGVVSVRSELTYRTDDLEPVGMWTGFSP